MTDEWDTNAVCTMQVKQPFNETQQWCHKIRQQTDPNEVASRSDNKETQNEVDIR